MLFLHIVRTRVQHIKGIDVSYQEIRFIHRQAIWTAVCRNLLYLSVRADDAVLVEVCRRAHRQRTVHGGHGAVLLVHGLVFGSASFAAGHLAVVPHHVWQFRRE